MGDDGGSGQLGDIEKHIPIWEGRFLRTSSVGDAAKFKTSETALRLSQAASQASQSGPDAAAAEPLAADGGGRGGAGTDAQVIELARKISAMEAQIERIEERNGILEESIQTPNSDFFPAMYHLWQCASSLQNYPGPRDAQREVSTRPPRCCVLSCF